MPTILEDVTLDEGLDRLLSWMLDLHQRIGVDAPFVFPLLGFDLKIRAQDLSQRLAPELMYGKRWIEVLGLDPPSGRPLVRLTAEGFAAARALKSGGDGDRGPAPIGF